MRKRIIVFLSILITLVTQNMVGQSNPSFPTHMNSPKWYVGENYFMSSLMREVEYIGSEIMCGQIYSEIEIENYSKNIFIRVEGEKVYGRKNNRCNEKEYLLYDFSVEVGDSIYVGSSVIYPIGKAADTALFKVVVVDSVKIEGETTKRIKLLYDRCYQSNLFDTAYWIRGVGSVQHPFYSFICYCDVCEVEAKLMCMFLEDELKYEGPFDCSTIVSTEGVDNVIMNVFPRIINQTVSVKSISQIERVAMYTLNGLRLSIEVQRVDQNTTLVKLLKNHYSGLLLLSVQVGGTVNTYKLVKT